MCSWRPSESLLICPCLLSPWPPLTVITALCVVMSAFVYVGVSDCIAGGLLQKVCSVVSQVRIPKHTHVFTFLPWVTLPPKVFTEEALQNKSCLTSFQLQ